MAYFDNPEKAARWERELAGLRAEKERRQASLPVLSRDVGISLAPPAIGTRAAFGVARIAEPKTWSPPVRLTAPSPAAFQPIFKTPATKTAKFALERKPISFAELMAEAGLSAPSPAAARSKSQAFAINPPKSNSEPISFDKLMKESKKTAPLPITFSQLQSEAAEKRAI